MRNLYKPNRYNVASIQAQQTLGGDVMQSDENGQYVEWRDYKWLLESYAFLQDQWKDLDAEVERLTAEVSYDNRTQLHVDKLAAEFTQCEVEKLKAEVERLRKAGDMCDQLLACFEMEGRKGVNIGRDMWLAAKEGKQS